MTLTDWLDEIEARCAAATPGPWFRWTEGGDVSSEPEDARVFQSSLTTTNEAGYVSATAQGAADCEFVAHARCDLPAALALVRAFAAVVDEAKKACDILELPFHGNDPFRLVGESIKLPSLRDAIAAADAAVAAQAGEGKDNG